MGKGHIKTPKLLNCGNCGVEFIGKHYMSRFCSTTCKTTFTGERYKRTGRNKSASLIRLYGITIDTYNEMLQSQDNKCAICLETPEKLYVDHNHDSGTVRGLLCMKCNAALGLFKDKQSNLLSAIAYLQGEQLKKVRG